jgi:Arc/MetJ-type ribon-helix-helix transcriptional regulator
MSSGLSPHVEQKIAEAVAGGLYPTREAVIEASVEHFLDDQIPMATEEHMALVEAAIESSNAGLSSEMTRQEWAELHQSIRDIAAGKTSSLD